MIYSGEKTKRISFPIGGIGTGCVGLSGRGELVEWEIFNRPSKGTRNGYSHFAIKTNYNGKTYAKVLQGDTTESYMGKSDLGWFCGIGFGPRQDSMAGFPHFKDVTFDGEFPVARLSFAEEGFPCIARLCALNPFIPHDEDASSLPCGIYEWEIENTTDTALEYALAFTVENPAEVSQNVKINDSAYKGVTLINKGVPKEDAEYFDLSVITSHPRTTVQSYWYRGGWQDPVTAYWKNFTECDTMPEREYDATGRSDRATVVAYVKIEPKGTCKIPFVLSWNCPNNYCYWDDYKDKDGKTPTWKNYYATKFEDSLKSGEYVLDNIEYLGEKTKVFAKALWQATLPDFVKDAVSANLSVLKSPVTLRLEDGSLWGWEGLHQTKGSCEGSCQHVWNYAYALPFLFPRLERSLRENTMKYAMFENGGTAFRVQLPLGREPKWWRSCVDGQMGEVIKCYREWKISGDERWLAEHIDKIIKMVEFAWSEENPDKWDRDMDGVLEGRQHHTLDMELFGPSSWLQGFYLLALDCAAQMAERVGRADFAKKCREIYENGKGWVNENLFNGKYFYHKIDLKDKGIIDAYPETESYWNPEAQEIKYQVAQGCIIDQMLSDWHAHLIGCEGVFFKEKKDIALNSLFENNFKSSMRQVTNMWRNFALNDEGGALICTYPNGAVTPVMPIPYCEETMTGFEYALAGLLIAEGEREKGEAIVKAIRDRYDGEKRNPFSEIECGNNYARSMASFALMNIYSGFTYDMTKKHIGFNPQAEGQYFWSVGNTYGTVEISNNGCAIYVYGEMLELNSLSIPAINTVTGAEVDSKECHCELSGGVLKGNWKIKREFKIKCEVLR